MKLGITGYPLTYTRSPGLHRGFLRASGSKGSYDVLPFKPALGRRAFCRFLDGLRDEGYRGINVTVPLKEWAFEYVARCGGFTRDQHGRCAQLAGAVNTLVFSAGKVRGANTDSVGLWDDVAEWFARKRIRRFDVLVVGTGGAAKGAIAGILTRHGVTREICSSRVWGRNKRKARRLERLLRSQDRSACGTETAGKHPLLVVWCLPPVASKQAKRIWNGLKRDRQGSGDGLFLYDLNYGTRAISTRGLVPAVRRRSGSGMLRRQAEASFAMWFES